MTDLLLQLQTFAFVLILELVLLDLDALESLDAELDIGGERVDVAGCFANEASKFTLDKAEHLGLDIGEIKGITVVGLLLGLVVL